MNITPNAKTKVIRPRAVPISASWPSTPCPAAASDRKPCHRTDDRIANAATTNNEMMMP